MSGPQNYPPNFRFQGSFDPHLYDARYMQRQSSAGSANSVSGSTFSPASPTTTATLSDASCAVSPSALSAMSSPVAGAAAADYHTPSPGAFSPDGQNVNIPTGYDSWASADFDANAGSMAGYEYHQSNGYVMDYVSSPIDLPGGYMQQNYTDNSTYSQPLEPSHGDEDINGDSGSPESIPDYLITLYNFIAVGENAPYWKLKPEFESAGHRKVVPACDQKEEGVACVCLFQGCEQTVFKRKADLDRHYYQLHREVTDKKAYFCDHDRCTRKVSNPFYRLDHCRDHLREFHKEDLIKRNDPRPIAQVLDHCSLQSKWWRCSKDLTRVFIKDHGFFCPNCKGQCEKERMDRRSRAMAEKKQDGADHDDDDDNGKGDSKNSGHYEPPKKGSGSSDRRGGEKTADGQHRHHHGSTASGTSSRNKGSSSAGSSSSRSKASSSASGNKEKHSSGNRRGPNAQQQNEQAWTAQDAEWVTAYTGIKSEGNANYDLDWNQDGYTEQ